MVMVDKWGETGRRRSFRQGIGASVARLVVKLVGMPFKKPMRWPARGELSDHLRKDVGLPPAERRPDWLDRF